MDIKKIIKDHALNNGFTETKLNEVYSKVNICTTCNEIHTVLIIKNDMIVIKDYCPQKACNLNMNMSFNFTTIKDAQDAINSIIEELPNNDYNIENIPLEEKLGITTGVINSNFIFIRDKDDTSTTN